MVGSGEEVEFEKPVVEDVRSSEEEVLSLRALLEERYAVDILELAEFCRKNKLDKDVWEINKIIEIAATYIKEKGVVVSDAKILAAPVPMDYTEAEILLEKAREMRCRAVSEKEIPVMVGDAYHTLRYLLSEEVVKQIKSLLGEAMLRDILDKVRVDLTQEFEGLIENGNEVPDVFRDTLRMMAVERLTHHLKMSVANTDVMLFKRLEGIESSIKRDVENMKGKLMEEVEKKMQLVRFAEEGHFTT